MFSRILLNPATVMRPRLQKLTLKPDRSFRFEERRLARFDAPWHFHPELELTLIASSRGRRFVGDNIEPFAAGDLVLLGPNLPHFWHNEGPQADGERAHSVVVQFRKEFLGPTFFDLPELAGTKRLLARSARGLSFPARTAARIGQRLRQLGSRTGAAAIAELLGILDELARGQARPLASVSYLPVLDPAAEERLARVYAYLNASFRDPLTLGDIARVAAMTPEAFSRYFKRVVGRNISEIVTQLRIDYASRCLIETARPIGTIALDAGFATLSSFNRQFRRLQGMPPRDYRSAFQRAESDIGQQGRLSHRFTSR